MRGLLGLAMAVLAGCSCDAGHSFVLIIPGAAEPERAWITFGDTEHPMDCMYIEAFEEVHCDAPDDTRDRPVEEVSSIGFVMDGERIEVALAPVF